MKNLWEWLGQLPYHNWVIFAGLAVLFLAWLIVEIYPARMRLPAPVSVPPPDPLPPREAEWFWEKEAAAAVAAHAVRGLPLGRNGERTPYQLGEHRWSGKGSAYCHAVHTATGEHILKVFLKPGNTQVAAAYQEVEQFREAHPLLNKYLCPARWIPDALPVRDETGTAIPRDVVFMPFQGKMLADFIADSLASTAPENTLRPLAGNFRRMVRELHQAGYIHGDYNLGNIAVNESFLPVLIDLDTFCCRERPAAVFTMGGQPGFQPEYRLDATYSQENKVFRACPEKSDFFSEWVIYTSLMAYAIMGDAFENPTAESTLFGGGCGWLERDRLDDPDNPLSKLRSSKHPLLVGMAANITAVCANAYDPELLSPLEELFTDEQFCEWETNIDPFLRRMRKHL